LLDALKQLATWEWIKTNGKSIKTKCLGTNSLKCVWKMKISSRALNYRDRSMSMSSSMKKRSKSMNETDS
jgi:hypothetical protein